MSQETPVSAGSRQLTIRAVLTGMLFGGALSLCNIYTGLKVGWGLGMSITAALLGYGLWRLLALTRKTSGFDILETNINQTAASSAAAISSAGLVAPIPALTMITGQTLSWTELVVWTFSVCLVGIIVATGLRKQLIEVDQLTFPGGVATGETLREMYSHGREALARVWMLGGAAIVAALVKITEHVVPLGKLALPGSVPLKPGSRATLANLGFAFEPTTLMYGVGALIGPRVGISMMIGALVAWGWLAPFAFTRGWADMGPADPAATWFKDGVRWLLWPGVSMMVFAALTSFAFSWRSVVRALMPSSGAGVGEDEEAILPRKWFIVALVVITALSVGLQVAFFSITAWVAVLGVLLTFLLALVAARVSGETNITPVGAMGKVTQLIFAVLAPGQPAANLMAANVTGGAASQCADLMHDLKTGHMLGARPRSQMVAQVCGSFAGALAGSAGYLILVPDPAKMLMTPDWPAPAVATWKAVAELFQQGLGALPTGAVQGIVIGGLLGIVLAVLEKTLPQRARVWVPSPASIGLAFVIPAYNAISMFLGGIAAWALGKKVPSWSARFLIVLASGLIAGESLSGVGLAIWEILTGD
ncbi:MAG: OPT/YSL family transporter [Akkermansiaceae bacterium]|nr:OPT/YSL family transporter [Akkermansiaceae bacterium]MCP5542846.1 OPT/YSL family transporter [Akkermansiaceae bacterium]MCP5547096.1 OPT/YSL family transporter [Akkermansiaceae bacterium]